MSYSIRKQTTSYVVISISILSTVLCVALYMVSRSILIHSFDDDLLLEFQSIASVSRIWPDGDFYVDLDFDVATQYNKGGKRYFQAWDSSLSEVIDRSPFIEETDSQWPLPINQLGNEPVFTDMYIDDKSVRVVMQRINAQWGWAEQQPNLTVPSDVENFTLVLMVGRDRDSLINALFVLGTWTFVVGFVLVAMSWGVVNFLVGRGMKSFAVMASKIENIATSEDSMVVDDSWPDEVKPVVETLNQLLLRIDASVQRIRRFTADAAHELRTPLAELRLLTDVALRSTENEQRLLEAVQQSNGLSHSMANTVNAMLQLARIQSGNHPVEVSQESIDLSLFVQSLIDPLYEKAQGKKLTVLFEPTVDFFCELDRELGKLVFKNLIGNAIEYAAFGSTISIQLKKKSKGFVFAIENQTENITKEDIANFTTPFWRKGESRHQRDHVGLGLALVDEACQLMNWSLTIALTDTQNIRCTVN